MKKIISLALVVASILMMSVYSFARSNQPEQFKDTIDEACTKINEIANQVNSNLHASYFENNSLGSGCLIFEGTNPKNDDIVAFIAFQNEDMKQITDKNSKFSGMLVAGVVSHDLVEESLVIAGLYANNDEEEVVNNIIKPAMENSNTVYKVDDVYYLIKLSDNKTNVLFAISLISFDGSTPVIENSKRDSESAEIEPETSNSGSSNVNPDFKKQVDELEAFFNDYFDIMGKVATGDLSAIAQMATFLTEYDAKMQELDEIGSEDLSVADLAYYMESYSRIIAKIGTFGN